MWQNEHVHTLINFSQVLQPGSIWQERILQGKRAAHTRSAPTQEIFHVILKTQWEALLDLKCSYFPISTYIITATIIVTSINRNKGINLSSILLLWLLNFGAPRIKFHLNLPIVIIVIILRLMDQTFIFMPEWFCNRLFNGVTAL